MARPNYVGHIVDLEWNDAFDDDDVNLAALGPYYRWHTYGRVIRQTSELITIATAEGEPDVTYHATSVLWPMVVKVRILERGAER